MRRLILAAAAALSLLPLPALADAATIAWLDQASATLRRGGVNTILKENCPPQFIASYVISRREIHICPLAATYGWPMLKEAIAHEAIHAAQHCNGDAMGGATLRPLGHYLMAKLPDTDPELGSFFQLMDLVRQQKQQQIEDSVAGRGDLFLLLEVEAYAFEDAPSEALDLFMAFCHP